MDMIWHMKVRIEVATSPEEHADNRISSIGLRW